MKKVGVVLLSITFVFVALATIFTININQTLLKPAFYKKILSDNNAYERFLDTDPKFFVSLFNDPESEQPDIFNKDNLANAINSIGSNTLKKIVETGIDVALSGFIKSDSLDQSIDLTEIKSNLVSSGDEISIAFAETIPDSYSLSTEDLSAPNLGGLSVIIINIVLIVLLVILLASIWLLSESWESRFKTLGILLFVVSLPILVVSILALYVIPINFQVYPEIAELVLDLVKSLRDGFISLFLIEALVMGILALVLYVLAVVVLKKSDKLLPEEN